MSLIQQLSNLTSKPKSNPEEVIPRECGLEEASNLIQELIVNEENQDWIVSFQEGTSGNLEQRNKCFEIIRELLDRNTITVIGFDNSMDAAEAIFKHRYGLGVIEEHRYDNSVDEIRVSPKGRVFLTRRGKLERTNVYLMPEQVKNYIDRLIPYDDVGVNLDHSNPTLELVRDDWTRLTAVGAPVVKSFAFALRKHGNIEITPDSLIKLQTFDEKTWNIMSLLTRGRLNQLICGGVNSGKTTLLKLLIGELPDYLAVRIVDFDNELRVSEMYPDRDIWELEVHSEVDASFSKLFATILRLTPDVIIVPEFRGLGEVDITIESCIRGHNGSMGTCHFHSYFSVKDIIRNISILAIKEGLNLPVELVMERVASAFNIIIQTHADSKTGIKKITGITEIYVENGEIKENPLVRWIPFNEDVWIEGEWKIINKPSGYSRKIMNQFGVTNKEIENAFKGG